MRKTLVSMSILPVLVIFASIMVQAQESHPIYDNAPVPGQGSHPVYDNSPTGESHPTYDNTLPIAIGGTSEIGRSINNLRMVKEELNRAPPDQSGRREKALAHVNAALQELLNIQKSGQ